MNSFLSAIFQEITCFLINFSRFPIDARKNPQELSLFVFLLLIFKFLKIKSEKNNKINKYIPIIFFVNSKFFHSIIKKINKISYFTIILKPNLEVFFLKKDFNRLYNIFE